MGRQLRDRIEIIFHARDLRRRRGLRDHRLKLLASVGYDQNAFVGEADHGNARVTIQGFANLAIAKSQVFKHRS